MHLHPFLVLASVGLAATTACVPSYQFNDSTDAATTDAPPDGTVVPHTPPDAGDTGVTTQADADAGMEMDADAAPQDPHAITSLSAGGDDTCFVQDGKVYCFGGMNQYGQLGTTAFATGFITSPRAIDAPPFTAADEVRLSKPEDGKSGFACARAAGAVYCWGYAEFGQRGDKGSGTAEDGPQVTKVPFLGQGAIEVATGAYHACAIVDTSGSGNDDSNVYCWGYDGVDALGPLDQVGNPNHVVGVPAMKEIAAGGMFTCGITQTSGDILCWGYSETWRAGQEAFDAGAPVPNGSCIHLDDCNPRKIALPAGAAAPAKLALGKNFACALTTAGEVYCWGRDNAGQLGATIPPTTPCPFPASGLQDGQCSLTPVKTIASGATQITAGFDHACARMATGTASCWGYNADGQLGTGGNGTSFAPARVVDPANPASSLPVDAVAAGANHTCAVSGSKLYCWGSAVSADAGANAPTPVTF